MIRLQVEDMPSMEAVRGPILAFLILWDPRSLLCLSPRALLPWMFSCLPFLLLLMVVTKVPVVLAVEAVVTLAINLCLAPMPASYKGVLFSRFQARSSKSNTSKECKGKQEQLHCKTESLWQTSGQEGFNPFI